MSVEFTYKINAVVIDEPFLVENIEEYDFTIENTGDEAGTDLGFYIRSASNMGPFEYPSVDSPASNRTEILSHGDDGYGLVITQGSVATRFKISQGDTYETRIPLTVGTGEGDELSVGDTAEVTIEITFPVGTPSKTFYVDLVLE